MIINCIAVDDEPLALSKMKKYIDRIDFLNLLGVFNNGVDAINFIKNNPVDLVFLDIQMDDLTGIELIESLKNRPKVIFTTAYDSYALKGYELDVTDYLLKPISFQRFIKAVDRVFDQMSGSDKSISDNKDIGKEQAVHDFIFVKTEYRQQKIDLSEILFVEGMKDYIRIWTEKEKIMTLMNFAQIMEILPSDNFVRVHKSYIVALNKIHSIERNKIKINDQLIPIGESYKQYFISVIRKKNPV